MLSIRYAHRFLSSQAFYPLVFSSVIALTFMFVRILYSQSFEYRNLAHGAGVTVGQQPYPRGNPEEADFPRFRALFEWVFKLEKYTKGPVGVSDVGLYLPLKKWDAPHLGVPALGETEGLHTALMRDQWQYDVIRTLADLKSYHLVVVGEHRAMSDAEAGALRSYVRDGGACW